MAASASAILVERGRAGSSSDGDMAVADTMVSKRVELAWLHAGWYRRGVTLSSKLTIKLGATPWLTQTFARLYSARFAA